MTSLHSTLETLLKEMKTSYDYPQGVASEPSRIRYEVAGYAAQQPITDNSVIAVVWRSSGAEGGSCWGDEAQYWSSDQPDGELTLLDSLLTEVAPNITFLQYKKLSQMIHSDGFTEHEYYGNYTNYSCRYIRVKDIEDFLASCESS